MMCFDENCLRKEEFVKSIPLEHKKRGHFDEII